MESLHALQITDAIQALAAAQARYEITVDRLDRNDSGIGWEVRPTTTEIEVAKGQLYYLLQETP